MKKFTALLLATCACFSMATVFTACNDTPPDNPPDTSDYTVTESEWKINFNFMNTQTAAPACLCVYAEQTQELACDYEVTAEAASLAEITSYTLHAEGEAYGSTGYATLKVAPNALESEFYADGQFHPGESGKFASDTTFYIGLTQILSWYFPFADYYDDFVFDDTEKAYFCSNLISMQRDIYDPDDIFYVYTKTAKIEFENGYLKKVTVQMCDDENFGEVMSNFVFTFSNINNTTVTL